MTGIRMRRAARAGVAGLVVAGALLLAGCSNDPLADQYLSGDSKNYIAGDGTVTEIEPDSRQQPVDFSGTTAEGSAVSQADYSGEVVVLNFWYASCAPCRVEAPELAKLSEKYDGQGASFLGVNVRDQAPQAISFEKNYGITYPSVIDTDGALQLAFSGEVSPNAVPTTLVIDKQGRVAARILGQVSEPSILDTLIRDTIAESS
ncbi:TlpA family protein disulfide reductase [Agreia pratensis]|uniref:Thiol-disulfide isomerase or thioredoxin n=1 Tax=Agreia pratensis TaxID=150121 RepID=A0A1X7IQ32_9MICO|nr:TlpA disulfide reductase family protein [Agreia pratensis]SMG17173.1 Thiol-disulfide isomerase or thioredoxin [Agreia pratensis]